jgi:hypothetical protein
MLHRDLEGLMLNSLNESNVMLHKNNEVMILIRLNESNVYVNVTQGFERNIVEQFK